MRKRVWIASTTGILIVIIVIGISIFSTKDGEIPVPSNSLTVAFITGEESIGTGGVNDDIWLGLQDCKEEYGIRLRIYEVKGTESDFEQFQIAAVEGADLIIVKSDYAAKAMRYIRALNEEHPRIKLAIIDDAGRRSDYEQRGEFEKGKFSLSVEWMEPKTQELSYLAGYIACKTSQSGIAEIVLPEGENGQEAEKGLKTGIYESGKACDVRMIEAKDNDDIRAVLENSKRRGADTVILTLRCDDAYAAKLGKEMGINVITDLKINYSNMAKWAVRSTAPTMFSPGFFQLGYAEEVVYFDWDESKLPTDLLSSLEDVCDAIETDFAVPYTESMYAQYIKNKVNN